jgi:hypothetical protein
MQEVTGSIPVSPTIGIENYYVLIDWRIEIDDHPVIVVVCFNM